MTASRGGIGRSGALVIVLAVLAGGIWAATALGRTPAAARSSAPTVAVVHLLAPRIAAVKRHDGGIAVLLPTTMPLPEPDYTASSASPGAYRLEIDGAEPCDGANVCLFALFTARRGGALYGTRLTLSHGVRGAFSDIQCGAACSPASIEWIERGVLYTIEANPSIEDHPNVAPDALRAVFVTAANQAIAAGPR